MSALVLHAANCLCLDCVADRRAEVDARCDEARARTEELAGRRSAFFEATMPLAKIRRPQPGSLPALRKLGRVAR